MVLCTDIHQAGVFLKESLPEISSLLMSSDRVSLITATVFYHKIPNPIPGFGVLIPRGEGFRTLGILANSQIFEHRGSLYNETWILGGARDEAILDFSEAQLKELILKERGQMEIEKRREGEKNLEVAHLQITRWRKTLPHYTHRLERISEVLSQDLPPYYFVGNYLQGIGLTKILARARAVVGRLARDREESHRREKNGGTGVEST